MINKKSGLIIHPEVSNIFKQILDKEPNFSAIDRLWEFTKFDDRETVDFVIWHEPYSNAGILTWRENTKRNNQTKAQVTKIGRAIKDIFDRNSQPIAEADVEKIVNYWKSLSDPSDIEIVKGEEIKFWYLRENYAYPGAPTRPNPSSNNGGGGNTPRRTPSLYTTSNLSMYGVLPTTENREEATERRREWEWEENPQPAINEDRVDHGVPIENIDNIIDEIGDAIEGNIQVEPVDVTRVAQEALNRILANNPEIHVVTGSVTTNIGSSYRSQPRQTTPTSREEEAPRQEEYLVKGSLSKSCMRYPDCSHLLDIYSDSPDISLMIIKDENGKLLSRALIWKLDNGRTVMDRVYYSDESHITKYERYAQTMGWDYALTRYFPGERRWSVNGKIVSESDSNFIFGPMKEYSSWPYIDTFCYMDWETGNLMSSKRGIKTKTCLELHDIRGNSKLISTKNQGSFIQREVDWMLAKSDLKILFKEGGIGKISKEAKAELMKKSYEEGWEMTAIICPSDWDWDEWFQYVMKACDRGCVVGTLRLKSSFTDEQWNIFIKEPRVKVIRYYMSLINVPIEYSQIMLKENGWDNRYIDINPILLNLPDDMALGYMDALKRVHPTNVILSAHKSISMNARAEYLLSLKRKMDMTDVDWLTMILSENVRNGIAVDKNWILRLSEDDRILVSLNSYKKYSVDIFQHMEVPSYKDIRVKFDKSMDLSNMKDVLNSTKVSMSSKKTKKTGDWGSMEFNSPLPLWEVDNVASSIKKGFEEVSKKSGEMSNDEHWD